MVQKRLICGIKLSQKELSITPPLCDACMKGKATHASFPASKSGQAKSVLDLVHSDLWGPAPVRSIDGTHYVLTFTNDKSQWLWVHFLKFKAKAFQAFVEWLTYAERETGKVLCTIWMDNRGEYLSKLCDKFLKGQGIHHELTSPYTPEQNGISKCQNHTIFDHVRTILINSGDEPPHQIRSYTLLFSLFLHFPYIADPPLRTSALTRPHAIALTLTQQSHSLYQTDLAYLC